MFAVAVKLIDKHFRRKIAVLKLSASVFSPPSTAQLSLSMITYFLLGLTRPKSMNPPLKTHKSLKSNCPPKCIYIESVN